MTTDREKGLYQLHQNAGPEFLAYRLGQIFTIIESEEDRIIHNDVMADISVILEGEKTGFIRSVADLVFNIKDNKRKRFLFRLAEQILHIGQMKGIK